MKKLELTIAIMLIAATAFAGFGVVAVTTAETQVLPASSVRLWYVVQNPTTNAVYLKLDGSTNALTTTNGFRLDAGATISVSANKANPSRNRITAISTSGTNSITYQEGNEN
jgi:hypothetical protein